MKQMYSRADTLLAHLKKFVRNEFNRMGLLGLDELNVLNTQTQTEQMFIRLKQENLKIFMDAAQHAQEHALKLVEEVKDGDTVKSDNIGSLVWITAFLAGYNKSTGYLYDSETDRKRMRYNEEILTAREYGDRTRFNQATEKSANLWYGQSEQYLLDTVDEATLETYKNNGIKYVKWMTESDDRVCKECQSRHGVIYPIDSVPDKPHRRCRCYLVPVKGKNK